MMYRMKWFQFCILAIVLLPTVAFANDISIRPFLIDNTMVARESADETIVLTSEYENRKSIVYATVNEITVGTNGEIKEFISPVMTDRTNTVTSWIEITRGRIELMSGESVEIPLTIKVHPFAEPGEYHAFIGFVETKKRADAESIAMRGDADGVIVKITVADERVDSMRITNMTVDRFVTDTNTQDITVTIENSGDIASAPGGEIIFYNNRGAEVSAVFVNNEDLTVQPNSSRTFAATIPIEDGFGRFKANANLSYGQNQTASLFDSVGFFMLPLYYLYIAIALLLLLLILLYVLARRSQDGQMAADAGDDVAVFIRDGHNPNPKHHDIDLSK